MLFLVVLHGLASLVMSTPLVEIRVEQTLGAMISLWGLSFHRGPTVHGQQGTGTNSGCNLLLAEVAEADGQIQRLAEFGEKMHASNMHTYTCSVAKG